MPKSEFWPFSSKAVEEQNVGGESSVLQKQVLLMESEMEEMRLELAAIKRERLCSSSRPPTEPDQMFLGKDTSGIYKNVIKSQNEEDFSVKVLPLKTVSQLREELIRAKNTADEERFQREKSERKLRDLETKLNGICSRGADEVKETRKTSDEVANLKKQLRSLREEMEELKTTASEKSDEVQEYRVKYLQAQQQVEELRRQIDVMELDNKQVSDQIQIEIQRMKMQFQEKLQELAPLPDLLKGAQIQLQEARQLQKLAEDSSEHLSDELNRVKEKLIAAVTNLNAEKADRKTVVEENNALKDEVDMGKKEIEELCRNIDDYKCQVLRLEEKLSQLDLRYQEKAEECARLVKDVEELREEGSRSLSRSKERAESMRRYMNTQVSELERQLIQTRAQCRTFQKERDDVRQRMQLQVNSLQENFDIAELRLRALQNQVTSLKNSYAIILSDEDEDLQKSPRLNEYLQM
ncbi:outer dense fiber protein 2-like isoform X1 [Maniola jurtina]|uniref:outer dense fiber protein 2-like isoform X1 n=1 Tax=Maniola jurtina TaxID=191418 RepID=UPI001E688069|nr:outer dense fiber protein 2-like isoform X1 [Maniola jurtina]